MAQIPDPADVLSRVPVQLFIGGQWRPATGDRTFPVTDPATGRTLAEVADAGPADGVAALAAAADVAEAWARTSPRQRADLLRAAYDAVMARLEEFALLMTLEMGKPLAESRAEVAYAAGFLRWFSEEAVRIPGHYGLLPEGTGHMVVSRHPVGPSYLITPWNFPLAMATRKLGPALAAGCPVVIKPAEATPLSTLRFTALLAELGLPPGVVNVVTTTDPGGLSGPLLADPRLRKLSFTGSIPVGRRLLAQAADRVLRTSMELGGNAPFVVFEDADVAQAVAGAMVAKFRNIGQACTAANRFLVHRSVLAQFTEQITARVQALRVGPGVDPQVDIGPLVSEAAVAKVEELVADAIARGAELRTGGHRIDGPGHFYAPTVLVGVSPDSRIAREEIFGPVVAIGVFQDEDEAVRLANDTEAGLVSYVYTRDLARAQRMGVRLETGMLGVNVGVVSNPAAPFGGVKQSGIGREGGAEGILEYLETRYILTADPFA
ncbi:MAG TPA: NAD-dependent succinate-semialdehyde dehydrogenase [Natronosporangium sp.]|nr:NAD-dependent succinate-semialdehyde dehydrogenase [Natronosporangium sp.]